MDAFAGYKRAAARQAPRAAEVLDPFHVVQLAGQKLTKVRCRLRRETAGRRGTRSDPLYRCGRILLKTESPRTDRQRERPTRSWRTRRTGRCASRTAPAKAAPNSPSWGAP